MLFRSTSTSTGVLILPQDGLPPVVGDYLQAPSGTLLNITGVIEPDIDKYSGKLMYIDNRQAFTTTEDQSVSIKTVFKY